MALVLLSLLGVIVSLILYYLHITFTYWEKRGVPFERPLPLIGNMKGLTKTMSFHEFCCQYYKKFKGTAPFAGMYMTIRKVAFLLDLDLIKQILIKDFSNFHDRGAYSNVEDDPLTGHLFSIDGEQWRAMRHKLSPVFTSGKMKIMFNTVVAESEKLVQACETMMKEDVNGELDVKELSARFTTDVIASCAFGLDCDSLGNPTCEFREKARLILTDKRYPEIVNLFMFTNPELGRKFHLKIFTDNISKYFMEIVRSTVKYRLENNIKRNDFLNLLIELKASDEDLARKSKGIDLSHGLTMEQMAAQALVFILAGSETSSSAMGFCLYELASNKEIQNKLREEIIGVLQRHDNEITYENLKEMHYLDMVMCETLRKYTTLPQITRVAERDYKVPNSNLVIEKGTLCSIPLAALHSDPEYFPEPQKFDPNRFTPDKVQERHTAAFIPFGDGPRNCIGLRFGKVQFKIGIIQLVKNFEFSVTKNTELRYDKKSFIIALESGISLHAQKI